MPGMTTRVRMTPDERREQNDIGLQPRLAVHDDPTLAALQRVSDESTQSAAVLRHPGRRREATLRRGASG